MEFELPANKILNIQSQLEALIGKNYYLNKSAKEGYKGTHASGTCFLPWHQTN